MAHAQTTSSISDSDGTAVSKALFQRARKVMPSGYTRQMTVTKPHPQYALEADGCWITDVDGNRRIDWVNNFSSMIHGHNRREIVEVIASQAGRLMSAILPTEWEVMLAELLVERIPSVERVRFMNSGTEANMIAVKAARAYTGRSKIAKMEGGYHGQYDLLEASFQPKPDQWGDPKVPTPVAGQVGHPQSLLDEIVLLPMNDIEGARNILRTRGHEIAGLILDPYRLQLGLVEPRVDFIAMLREETERMGIVLIFDEVWALRTHYNGTQGMIGITPDLTTMGKIIGGGLPIGGLGGKTQFMSVFEVDKGEPKVKHSGTFTANPMSMATGYTSMSLLTEAVFADLNAKGDRLREGLEKVRKDLKVPGRVVGKGSMTALIMTDLPMTNYRELLTAMASGLAARMDRYQKLLLDEGLLTMRGGFIGSTPMTNEDIDFTLRGVRSALARLMSS